LLVQPDIAGPHALVIYFGGNGEEVSPMVTQARHFPGCALLVMNYRGYGSSEGKPSERALVADALSLYDHAAALPGIDGKRIIAMGRSLGSGVAVALAASRPLAGVILVTPYDSMVAVAHTHYPLLPVSLLLKHRFESAERAPAIHAPGLILTAGDDRVIPRKHSDALYAVWGGAKTKVEIPGADHNSIDAYPAYWSAIADFLRSALAAALLPTA
jgi:pimeloyl-ACP methyl ester carboxylesterase